MKNIILVGMLLFSASLYGGKFDVIKFGKQVSRIDTKEIAQLVKQIDKSPYARRKLLAKTINSKVMDSGVVKVCKMKPEFCPVAKVAVVLARKSKYADELLATTDYPLDVIKYYSRHGDTFLDTMKGFGVGVSKVTAAHVELMRRRFPNMPNIAFHSMKEINDKMLVTLRYTGKKGWEASQKLMTLAKKHPKSTAVGVLMAWYVTDPESFFEQKEKLIDFVSSTLQEGTSDITKLTLGATQGIADGFVSTVKEKLTVKNSIVLLLLLFGFIMWKFRLLITKKFKKISKTEKNMNQNNDEGLL